MFALIIWGVLIIVLLAMIAPGTFGGILALVGLSLILAYIYTRSKIRRDLSELEEFYQDNADEIELNRAEYLDACRNEYHDACIRHKIQQQHESWKRRNPYRQHL